MYREHFGLKIHPFDKDIGIDELFISGASKELELRLTHLIDLRGIGLITGDVGSGKTTICRKIASKLHSGVYRVFYIPNSTGNVMDLYKSICWAFGLSVERSRAALYRSICAEVTRLVVESRVRPILIIDEAQHLRSDVLEDLRLLTNYDMDSQNRLCLVFVGQPELRRRIGLTVHEALSQRIVVRHQMAALTFEELDAYLTHLMRRAGTELPVFEPAALQAIYHATGGLPRKVNLLAHHALFAAAAQRLHTVNAEHVEAAIENIS
jgi:general secretion pathway protein A